MSPNWRSYGSPSPQRWRSIIEQAGGPAMLAHPDALAAAGEHGWLALAMLKAESSYGTHFNLNKAANKNPLNLRPPLRPDGTREPGDYMKFPLYPDAIRAWHYRITTPAYGGGIYARTVTIADLVHQYAPSSDNNDEAAYVRTIETLFDQWGVTPKETPMAELTYGKVPYPAVIQSHLPASNPYVQEGGAPDIPEAIFWHRMIGSWVGTNTWFHQGKAATAYGVSVAATDGTGGRIYEWIAPGNGWYGESSGPAVGPYGDGSKLIAKVGVGGVNRTTRAIEISGDVGTPLDTAARQAIIEITCYFADQKHIPWDQFPNVPNENRSFVIWHNEITGMTYKTCPGWLVMQETPALIVACQNYLKRFQVTGTVVVKPPQYAESELPEWWDEAIAQSYPGDQSENGVKFYALRRNFVAKTGTRRLSAPFGDAERSGPNLKLAEKVHAERYVVSDGGRWILTNDGHYVSAGKLSPPVKIN
jgi:hypothetical protein